jgi:hypothetical protein
MKKLLAAAVLAAACLALTQPASARSHYHRVAHYAPHHRHYSAARRIPARPAAPTQWSWNWGAQDARHDASRPPVDRQPGAVAESWYRRAPEQAAASGGLPGPCRQAARMGGPCGCWAEYTLFGRLEHVVGGWNAWLASSWLPSGGHSHLVGSVAEANAAVYLSRSGRAYHVAPIVAGVAHDSFGDHPVGGRVVLVRATI